jgi:hypothetical protein
MSEVILQMSMSLDGFVRFEWRTQCSPQTCTLQQMPDVAKAVVSSEAVDTTKRSSAGWELSDSKHDCGRISSTYPGDGKQESRRGPAAAGWPLTTGVISADDLVLGTDSLLNFRGQLVTSGPESTYFFFFRCSPKGAENVIAPVVPSLQLV